MGYYTRYDLSIYNSHSVKVYDPEEIAAINHRFIEIVGDSLGFFEGYIEHTDGVDDENFLENEIFCEPHKWYEHESDMLALSKEFPNYIFELAGSGEEQGDMWIKYFKNGKYQFAPASITYDECIFLEG